MTEQTLSDLVREYYADPTPQTLGRAWEVALNVAEAAAEKLQRTGLIHYPNDPDDIAAEVANEFMKNVQAQPRTIDPDRSCKALVGLMVKRKALTSVRSDARRGETNLSAYDSDRGGRSYVDTLVAQPDNLAEHMLAQIEPLFNDAVAAVEKKNANYACLARLTFLRRGINNAADALKDADIRERYLGSASVDPASVNVPAVLSADISKSHRAVMDELKRMADEYRAVASLSGTEAEKKNQLLNNAMDISDFLELAETNYGRARGGSGKSAKNPAA